MRLDVSVKIKKENRSLCIYNEVRMYIRGSCVLSVWRLVCVLCSCKFILEIYQAICREAIPKSH